MAISIEATYEDGTLRPAHPLPFREHQKVRLTIDEPSPGGLSRVQATYGLVGWQGDSETIQKVAVDPRFDIEESP